MSKAFSSFDAVFVQFTWMDRDVVYAPALANHAFHFRISKICHVLGLEDPVGTRNIFQIQQSDIEVAKVRGQFAIMLFLSD